MIQEKIKIIKLEKEHLGVLKALIDDTAKTWSLRLDDRVDAEIWVYRRKGENA